jgi:hypothetical protein
MKFRRSEEFFANFSENSRVVGVTTVSGISAALGVAAVAFMIAVACLPANECVPDVASISTAAGVPLVPDVLTVAGFPAFIGVPGVVGFPIFAFIPAIADVSAIVAVPAVDGVFEVDPGVPMLLQLISLLTVLYNKTYIGHRTIRLRLSDCHFFLLSNYQTIEYQTGEFEKLSDIGSRPQSIGLSDIGHIKNYRSPTSDIE